MIALAGLAWARARRQQAESLCPIQILVGKEHAVTVIVPDLRRKDLKDIISDFLSSPETKGKFDRLLDGAGALTLIIKTGCVEEDDAGNNNA